jgi:hypothetical protein
MIIIIQQLEFKGAFSFPSQGFCFSLARKKKSWNHRLLKHRETDVVNTHEKSE